MQYGFRIYTNDIRSLVPSLIYPSTDGRWKSLADFYREVVAGRIPVAYSRSIVISDGSRKVQATATIAKHGRTVQGYITAHLGTWLRDYVENRLHEDLECEYLIQPNQDFILIPLQGGSVKEKLDKSENTAKRIVRSQLRRMKCGPPPHAAEIGLYFETLEFRSLKAEFPPPRWNVHHRYPAIDSNVLFLRTNNVSCDIDVVTRNGDIVRCVEVKSVSGAPGSPFNLTRREWDSRVWCVRSDISYEIVVYYHARSQIIERRVIAASESIRHEPIGYWCYPP